MDFTKTNTDLSKEELAEWVADKVAAIVAEAKVLAPNCRVRLSSVDMRPRKSRNQEGYRSVEVIVHQRGKVESAIAKRTLGLGESEWPSR